MDGFRINIGLQRCAFSPHIYKFLASLSPLLLFPLPATPPLVGRNRCRRSSILCSSQLPRLLDLPRQLWLLWPREHSHVPKNPLTNTSSGDRVPCRLHLPRPCLSSWSACALPCFWTGQSPPPSFTQDCNCSVADIHNQSSGDRLPWSGGIVRSPKRRSRLGNTFCLKSFFLLFRIGDDCILIPISRNVSRPF